MVARSGPGQPGPRKATWLPSTPIAKPLWGTGNGNPLRPFGFGVRHLVKVRTRIVFRDDPRVHESDDGNGGFCRTYLLVDTPPSCCPILGGLLTLSFYGAEVLRGRSMRLPLFRTSLSGKPPSCFTGSSSRLVYSRTRLRQLMFAARNGLIFKVRLPSPKLMRCNRYAVTGLPPHANVDTRTAM
jgi:hypothetical protein